MIAQAGPPSGSNPDSMAQAAGGSAKARAASAIDVEKVRRNITAGGSIVVRGAMSPHSSGHPVALQVFRKRSWHTIDEDTTGAKGKYVLRWRPKGIGSTKMRLAFAGTATQTPASRRIGYANVYRSAMASWYGPGLYGNKLGCGGRLSPGTVGVAHKRLPCGSKVVLRYKGRTVRARVIDRGPYVGGREFDLTAATKSKLRFGSTGRIQVATG